MKQRWTAAGKERKRDTEEVEHRKQQVQLSTAKYAPKKGTQTAGCNNIKPPSPRRD